MRTRIAALLLIPTCLFTFIAGVAKSPEETIPVTEATEEMFDITTIPTETATIPVIEPTIQETTKPLSTEQTDTKPVATKPVATKPVVTEPVVTEPAIDDDGLRSLGTFTLTAYCPCQECCGKYALNRPVDEYGNEIVYGSIGVRLEAGVSIAVDPRVIPYGTKVVINGHTYIAQDTGGSIKGNRIDVYFDDHQETWDFGVQTAEVFVYEAY